MESKDKINTKLTELRGKRLLPIEKCSRKDRELIQKL